MKDDILHYDPKLKFLARDLRKNSTLAETKLWNVVRNKALKGYKFKRQVPIGKYIVDFYCRDLMLVIEIDGISHTQKIEKDIKRQKDLEAKGLTVLRFSESEVQKNFDGVSIYLYK